MKNVKVKIIKIGVIGVIQATTLPLKDDVNYSVLLYNSARLRRWCLGKELEIIED